MDNNVVFSIEELGHLSKVLDAVSPHLLTSRYGMESKSRIDKAIEGLKSEVGHHIRLYEAEPSNNAYRTKKLDKDVCTLISGISELTDANRLATAYNGTDHREMMASVVKLERKVTIGDRQTEWTMPKLLDRLEAKRSPLSNPGGAKRKTTTTNPATLSSLDELQKQMNEKRTQFQSDIVELTKQITAVRQKLGL